MATTKEAHAIIDDEALAEEELLAELESGEIPAHIREARVKQLKLQAKQYSGMKEKQHGQYTEIAEEKEFLAISTSEENCVVHFFHQDFRRCAIMDKHLQILSEKYFEVKFAKINVEAAKFFVEKLKIRILPAVICFKNGIVVDRIIGFEELGDEDDFRTVDLERRLNKCGVIEAKDLEEKKTSILGRNELNKNSEDTDSDDDW